MSAEREPSETPSPVAATKHPRLKALLAIVGVLLVVLAAVTYLTRDDNLSEAQLLAKPLDELKRLSGQPSADALVRYAYARKLFETGDLEAAKEPLEQALKDLPKDDASDLAGKLFAFAGYEAVSLNNPSFAEHYLESAEKISKDYPFALAARGAIALQQQRTIDAIEALSKATQGDPKLADAWKLLGRAYITGGEPEEALPALKTAAQLSPNDATVHTDMGQAYLLLKRPAEAEAEYQSAANLKPDDPYLATLPLRARAFAARTEDDFQKIAERIRGTLGLSPGDDGLRAELAGLYIRFHRFAEAKTELETILQHNPYISVSCWENLYTVCKRLGDAPAVQNAYERLKAIIETKARSYRLMEQAQLRPDDAQLLAQLGMVFLQMNKTEQATPLIARANQLAPNDPQVVQATRKAQESMNRPQGGARTGGSLPSTR